MYPVKSVSWGSARWIDSDKHRLATNPLRSPKIARNANRAPADGGGRKKNTVIANLATRRKMAICKQNLKLRNEVILFGLSETITSMLFPTASANKWVYEHRER